MRVETLNVYCLCQRYHHWMGSAFKNDWCHNQLSWGDWDYVHWLRRVSFLGTELDSPLCQDLEQASDNRIDGGTRRLVVAQLEGIRHEVLTKALKEHPDRQVRPIFTFPNVDKTSGAWILILPGPTTGLSSQVFAEPMASHLCLPSPVLATSGWVGQKVGRKGIIIDVFGDTVMNCNDLPGSNDCLAELKLISAGVTWYPRGADIRGTDKRAAGLDKLYQDNLSKLYRQFRVTASGQNGPLVQRLNNFGKVWGLVVGPWSN